MGYVAVSDKDKQSGLRDVVFAWRGTIAPTEWEMDIQDTMIEYEEDVPEVLMAQGFRNMYMRSPKGYDSPQVGGDTSFWTCDRQLPEHLLRWSRLCLVTSIEKPAAVWQAMD